MSTVNIILTVLGTVFGILYAYQVVFMLIGIFFKKKKFPKAKNLHSFAILISARNEEKVIKNLIDSIRSNEYPQEKIKIFVVADNCTDNTAQICRDLIVKEGSFEGDVFERFNDKQIGKGFALNFLFKQIAGTHPDYQPDAFFVFDADNILTKNYISEMNKALDSGIKVCTSYRNSKNYGTNWLSAGSSLCFMRECRFNHKSKQILRMSTHVSGTGFYVSKDVLNFKDGWKYFTLTEDLEFSTSKTLSGERIGYCEDAVFYDEQPSKFKQTWKQRARWSKGSLMSFSLFHLSVFTSFFKTLNFSFYDYYFSRLFPVGFYYGLMFLTSGIIQVIDIALNSISPSLSFVSKVLALPFISGLITTYLGLFIDGFLITVLEWKKIKASPWKKIKYMFTYPIFSIIFSIPVVFYALFKKVKWDPIEHTESVTQADLEKLR